MPSRTQLFLQLPWIGGVNTSIDEAMIPSNQLTVADNVVFDTRGSRRKREGISYDWDDGTDTAHSVVAIYTDAAFTFQAPSGGRYLNFLSVARVGN